MGTCFEALRELESSFQWCRYMCKKVKKKKKKSVFLSTHGYPDSSNSFNTLTNIF